MAKKLNFHGEMKETVIRKVSNLVTMFLDARYKNVIPLSHILFAQDTFLDDSILELKIREAKIRSSRMIEFHLKIILLIRP